MLIYMFNAAGPGRQPPVSNDLSTVRVISQISIILNYTRNPPDLFAMNLVALKMTSVHARQLY